MGKKKALYIKAQGLGDMISGIPKLIQLKEQGYEIHQIFYDIRYLTLFVTWARKTLFRKLPMGSSWRLRFLELLQKRNLVDSIFFIPYNFFSLVWFLIKHIRYFDEVIIPIKTKNALRISRIVGKKVTCIFENVNDTKPWRTSIEWEIWYDPGPLYQYHKLIQLETEKYELPDNYIAIYPSVRERSMDIEQRVKVIEYIISQNIAVVILGWDREHRFSDQLQHHEVRHKIINLMGKTTMKQAIRILEHSQLNISCNGWIMRIGNLVNKRNINIHTVSAFLMEPTVDSIYSYNLRLYDYPKCKPCEASSLPQQFTIPQCVFRDTKNEWACRKVTTAYKLIKYTQSLLKTI